MTIEGSILPQGTHVISPGAKFSCNKVVQLNFNVRNSMATEILVLTN